MVLFFPLKTFPITAELKILDHVYFLSTKARLKQLFVYLTRAGASLQNIVLLTFILETGLCICASSFFVSDLIPLLIQCKS